MDEPHKRAYSINDGHKQFIHAKSRRLHANPWRHIIYCYYILALIAFPVYAQAPERPQTPKIAVLNNNTLRPITTTTYKENITLGAISTEDLFSGLKYKTIIKCLAKYESGYRTDVYGDKGLAYGILQYHRATFNRFCTGDYYSARDQILCCENMLNTDFSLISHWTTSKYCKINN